MIERLLAAFAIALLLGGCKPGDETRDDLSKFQGEWKVAKGVKEGEALQADVRDKMTMTVKGASASIDSGDAREERATIELDPSQKPAAIDFKPTRKDGELMKGIYKFDGETLSICWARDGDRPTEFASAAGSKHLLLVLKRAKK